MRKLVALFICAFSYSAAALASPCDGSVLNILNIGNHPMKISTMVTDGTSTISTVNSGESSKGFNFIVKSGKGTKGNASGTITLVYADNQDKSPISINYQLHSKRNGEDLWLTSNCNANITVSGIPAASVQMIYNSQYRSPSQITLFLND